ncbi:aminotransferase class IV [Flavobacteriaceae bacterium F89]|uniref:branched-chain-amino-acid transaminase n=1 Tax=Cerina litoralis TaxID=2874477 RepID=A0AAE3EUP4_9FLAO|nr:aminotransferase class IV [Cerina litoralis]MCG2459982.1 aminotransferase class IV [Cerina litoralis]
MDTTVNFNGSLLLKDTNFLNHENRGLRYGDALFETLRIINGKIVFWEDHYLRLMASMRILRMEIPMTFTMEFLQEQLLRVILANDMENSPARVRLTVFRNNGGLYLPKSNDVSFIIEASALKDPYYTLDPSSYEVALFKDFYVNANKLSTLKTSNKLTHVLGSIFSNENNYDNCLLLNQNKFVVEALNANIFLVVNNTVKTPPIMDGCLNGIIRKKLKEIFTRLGNYAFEESSISPFELQKADELFITNSITGIRPITKFRKKEYSTKVALDLLGKLNAKAIAERT